MILNTLVVIYLAVRQRLTYQLVLVTIRRLYTFSLCLAKRKNLYQKKISYGAKLNSSAYYTKIPERVVDKRPQYRPCRYKQFPWSRHYLWLDLFDRLMDQSLSREIWRRQSTHDAGHYGKIVVPAH